LTPDGVVLEAFDLDGIPVFSEDAESAPVKNRCAEDTGSAPDAILFVTPEYNKSVPGGRKNAIDRASRP
jgi:chromate reductase